MKVLELHKYKDGGTVLIKTKLASFCIDNRLGTTTKGKLYKDLPKDDNSNLINEYDDIIDELIKGVTEYDSSNTEFKQSIIDQLLALKESLNGLPKIKKVTAWETSDGEIFKNENDAISYEKVLIEEKAKKITWEKLVAKLKKKNIHVYQTTYPWDCPESPIGTCVYQIEIDSGYDDECCYYCGEPEERK